MGSTTTPFALPPPPPDRARTGRMVVYAAAVVAGAAGVVLLGPVGAVCAVPIGVLAYLTTITRRHEIGAALATAALDRAARGRFDEARALLDGISKNVLSTYIGMMRDAQRAALALYEGDLETSVTLATRAARLGKRLGGVSRVHQSSALSIRAVALAGLGRKEEALADVARVRAADFRQGSFMARASLAEAMLFAREKNLDELARVLREDRVLLLGATNPRERMVVRALARMVAAKKVSIYREPAKREEQELDENASWVARLAPEAAGYARAPRLGDRLEAPVAVDPAAVKAAQKEAPKARRSVKRIAAIWVCLVVMFLAIWSLLGTSRAVSVEEPAPADGSSALALATALGAIVVVIGVIAFRLVRAKKLTARLASAMELRQRGRHEEARRALESLAANKVPMIAPQAERELATIAIAEGDFDRARRHAEAGIAATRVSPLALVLSRPVLLPQLHGVLAFALAAGGHTARADEELAQLPVLFPAYPYLARDTFSARLAGLAASERFDEAATMARERPADLPLSMQEELLCDALRLHAGDVLPEGERERIELDLRDDAGAMRCVDRIAPTLRSRVHARSHGPRVEPAPETPAAAEVIDDAPELEPPLARLLRS